MFPKKFKTAWKWLAPVLLILFFLSLLSGTKRKASWFQQWLWNTVAPISFVLSWAKGGVSNIWHHYIYLVHAAENNEVLLKEVGEFQQKFYSLKEVEQENKRLLNLLELKQSQWSEGIVARVISFDPRFEFKSIRIDKGEKEGVLPDMPVISLEGLVGRVGPVFRGDAVVLLIIDPASHVDVFVQRSRLRALLRGQGFMKHAELGHAFFLTSMEYLKKKSDIQVSDVIFSSGMDGLYPKGVPVGVVESVEPSSAGIFLKASVQPLVDFSKLEEVIILQRQ